MSYCVSDTIAAIATAPGGGLRGIVRVSGPATIECLQRCFSPDPPLDLRTVTHPRAIPGHVRTTDPAVAQLPCDVYLWPTSRSATRQVCAEVHTLGALPLLDVTLRTLCTCGARLARPGEFTLRAFLAGRIDLTQAEAVLGVIDARDSSSLAVALRQLAGGVTEPLARLREDLVDLLAHLEAGLDFVDGEIETLAPADLARRLAGAQDQVGQLLQRLASRATIVHEPRVVVRGWTNVGKSSLLNALSGDDAAMVSPIAGTTRDYVTRTVSCGGIACLLIDTPGADDTAAADDAAAADDTAAADDLARGARRLADEQTREAALELFCLDASRSINAWECTALQEPPAGERIVVLTKNDVRRPVAPEDRAAVRTSSRTGEGLDALRAMIAERARRSECGTVVASTAERCRVSLAAAAGSLSRAWQLAAGARGEELVAVEMRDALDQLGQVVGAVYTEDILERVFSRFCIGK